MKSSEAFVIMLGVGLLIACIAEIWLISTLYFNADYVECNGLWCSFITQRREVVFQHNNSKECYINDEMVNCSELKGDTDKWLK